ncbi:MAG: hypothetical protein R6V86_02890 [Spirochaetia bacterium]
MSNIQRVSISLLISIILVTAFAFLAYSGLFEYIETTFYNQRVTELYGQELQQKKRAIEDFHHQYQNRFAAALTQVDVQKVYSPNWDREYIFQHTNLFNKIHSENQGLLFVRFVSTDNKIHYSTRDDDIERQGEYRIIYKVIDEQTTNISISELKLDEEQSEDIVIDDTQNRFVYQFPLYDDLDQFRGTALFYVDRNSLQHFLVSKGLLQVDRQINLTENGYLFFGEGLSVDEIKETTSKRWDNNLVGERYVYHDEKTGQRFVLMSTETDGYGNIGLLVNQSLFEMGAVLKIILLSASGITVFLLLLLLFSLRQDREVIIRNRLKRFQLEFIKGYIESQERLDWRQLKSEVSRKKESLKGEMKKGLGKIKGEKEEKIDELIDESWQDIFKVLDGRSETQKQTSSQVSIDNIEEVVQKILSLQKTIESQGPSTGHTSESAPTSAKPSQNAEQEPTEEVEELEDFEEAEEIPEAEEAEQLEEIEELGELEEAEEPEEIEGLEETEEAPPEAEETEEVEELEDFEEAEEIPEAEEAEQPEEIEELGELEEAEEPEKAEENIEKTPRLYGKNEVAATAEMPTEDITHLIHADLEGYGSFSSEQKERAILSIQKIEHPSTEDIKSSDSGLAVVDKSEQVQDEPIEELETVSDEDDAFYQLQSAANDTYFRYNTAGVYDYSTVPVQGYLEVVGSEDEEIEEVEELTDELKEGSTMAGESRTPNETPEEHAGSGKEEDVQSDEDETQTNLEAEDDVEELEELDELEEIEELDELEEPEDLDEIEEVEEVEELQDVDEDVAEILGQKLETGVYRFQLQNVFEMPSVSNEEKKTDAIVYQNGTFQVDDSIFKPSVQPSDSDLSDLVNSVIDKDKGKDKEKDQDRKDSSSLGSIIGFGDVDLSFSIEEDSESRDDSTIGMPEASNTTLLNEAGFQYDVFLERYRSGKIGMLKSLMRISQRTGALYAAILERQGENWIVYDSVGFDKELTSNIVMQRNDELYQRFLAARQPVIFDLEQAQKYLYGIVSDRDREYINAVLFIPAIFQGGEAFLYLGLKRLATDIEGILQALSVM